MAERIVLEEDVSLYIDSTSIVYLFGLEIDWATEMLKEGFVFNNPNAKGSCGCGESFHV
jgi:iron-sulfur cluster assembly protein